MGWEGMMCRSENTHLCSFGGAFTEDFDLYVPKGRV
jgi:hypothetical protein